MVQSMNIVSEVDRSSFIPEYKVDEFLNFLENPTIEDLHPDHIIICWRPHGRHMELIEISDAIGDSFYISFFSTSHKTFKEFKEFYLESMNNKNMWVAPAGCKRGTIKEEV